MLIIPRIPGYKLIKTNNNETIIVDCSDFGVLHRGINVLVVNTETCPYSSDSYTTPVVEIRDISKGCPAFDRHYFESEETEKIEENIFIYRREGKRLYFVPLHVAFKDKPIDDFFSGKIVSEKDYAPSESAVVLYYQFYEEICKGLEEPDVK